MRRVDLKLRILVVYAQAREFPTGPFGILTAQPDLVIKAKYPQKFQSVKGVNQMTEIRKLARFITGLTFEQAPPEVRRAVKFCVLDTVSAGLGAKDNAQIRAMVDAYREISGKSPAASLWGYNEKLPIVAAAFLNGAMSHTLELDDVHTNSKAHIGTVVIPAAWALAEYLGSSGKAFLTAVLAGYETMARIGMGLGVSSHRNLGWHATSTAGTFGAAAACAKLLGLDEERTIWALGLAGTQSFGLWAFLEDGASNKVLHPARAASNGLESAILAKAGMSGAEHILDAKDGGMFPIMSREYDYSLVSRGLGEIWEILNLDNKPYPCCRSTHCTIDGALALYKDGITADSIVSVEVGTYLVGNNQCGISEGSRNPKKPVDARFSTPIRWRARCCSAK
jgi:2-methylcitrate dehydratase PrpD